ncbi:Nitrogen assimilation regulatory protein [Pirellulimonas nuda]|uniref:DNA-binding transcriptional regulator NtrC n=1 Tax=Pirellulimonas nuda TaxID=2528009 RepID=A0A518DG59_9BACT|nr:sigma-54 dependent transcriptional regulator [Pirellulimonas nuda]QDU90458.1 Nitrogen assimilation regulatory protein [Pirellulimonas nuda]
MIDDDPLVEVQVRRALHGLVPSIEARLSASDGLDLIRNARPDAVILDNILPDRLGIDTLAEIHRIDPRVPVIFVTARGSGSTAIEAMRLSAFDYLPKPIDPATLRCQVQRALELRRLLDAPPQQPANGSPAADADAESLVGDSPAMQHVFKAIGRIAMQDVPVLIRGEAGTGKEAVARAIHRHSGRAGSPFVCLRCSAFQGTDLDTELFGDGRPESGGVAAAAGGTLYLEEIAALTLPTQAKLLAIQQAWSRSGGREPTPCRVVASSAVDLEGLVRSGRLRSDLYYAISSFTIQLPPLRQRLTDLPLLIEQLLAQLCEVSPQHAAAPPRVSEEAYRVIARHTWPGNIDELRSVLKRSVVEAKGNVITSDYLKAVLARDPVVADGGPDTGSQNATDWDRFVDFRIDGGTEDLYAEAVAETDRKVLARVLRNTAGNQAHAARLLGITRASLRKKLRTLGISIQQVVESTAPS